jgi:hypothetical protein
MRPAAEARAARRETLPKVGERLEVAFTDQPYVGTVTALRRSKEPARKRRNSAVGAAGCGPI